MYVPMPASWSQLLGSGSWTSYESQRAQFRESLLAPNPDLGAVRSFFDSAQSSLATLAWIDVSAALEARAVLTPEQQVTAQASTGRRGRARRRGRGGAVMRGHR